jgi:hypothetical protein
MRYRSVLCMHYRATLTKALSLVVTLCSEDTCRALPLRVGLDWIRRAADGADRAVQAVY